MREFWKEIKYFKPSEFASKDTPDADLMDEEFVKILDRIRVKFGKPIIINSGHRTIEHNKSVGGRIDSSHLKGLAADIRCYKSNTRYLLMHYAKQEGINRFGMGDNYIHIDNDLTKSQGSIWLYLQKIYFDESGNATVTSFHL